MSGYCEIHHKTELNIICICPSCSKKGLLCVFCQHQEHLEHSNYCLPVKVFLEKSHRLRVKNRHKIKEIKKSLKEINDGSKEVLKEFMLNVSNLCGAISAEIDNSASMEQQFLQDIMSVNKAMSEDFKKFDGTLSTFRKFVKPYLEQEYQVDFIAEKGGSHVFSSRTTNERTVALTEMAMQTRALGEYLKDSLKKIEELLCSLVGNSGEVIAEVKGNIREPNRGKAKEVTFLNREKAIKNQENCQKSSDIFFHENQKLPSKSQKNELKSKNDPPFFFPNETNNYFQKFGDENKGMPSFNFPNFEQGDIPFPDQNFFAPQKNESIFGNKGKGNQRNMPVQNNRNNFLNPPQLNLFTKKPNPEIKKGNQNKNNANNNQKPFYNEIFPFGKNEKDQKKNIKPQQINIPAKSLFGKNPQNQNRDMDFTEFPGDARDDLENIFNSREEEEY